MTEVMREEVRKNVQVFKGDGKGTVLVIYYGIPYETKPIITNDGIRYWLKCNRL